MTWPAVIQNIVVMLTTAGLFVYTHSAWSFMFLLLALAPGKEEK